MTNQKTGAIISKTQNVVLPVNRVEPECRYADFVTVMIERIGKMSKGKINKIKLNEASDVEEFVKAAGKCDFDIDIFYNRVIIDAKSILGIMSMDLTQELTVHCYGESDEFERAIQKFAIA